MTTSWKAQMARRLVAQEDPEEVVALVDAVLPAVVEVLSSEQLRELVRHLFDEHLPTLLGGIDPADRVALLRDLLPVIARELSQQDILGEGLDL